MYVDYIDRRARLRVDEARPGRRSGFEPVIDHGPAATQHHGGQLQFLGTTLYVSTGMGDDDPVSQDPDDPGGKILRVDPRARPAVPEVYALGLRNPWCFSFHRGTLLIGDVGEDDAEEVDVVPAGALPGTNSGWPYREGREREQDCVAPAGLEPPALVRRHGDGWCSIVGGYVGRDPSVPELRGRYVYGVVCSGRVRSARLQGMRLVDDRALPLRVPYLVSCGQDGWAGCTRSASRAASGGLSTPARRSAQRSTTRPWRTVFSVTTRGSTNCRR